MTARRLVLKETLLVAAQEALVALAAALVYALLGKLGASVWVGLLGGAALSVLNYFIMACSASRVSESAAQAGAQGGGLMRVSYILRLVLLFGGLIALAATKLADPVALIIPLLLMQPIILLTHTILKRQVK
ncbi:MAG: ATP synthase subunit I [Clostridia bacterium]|nr:ATP synthase subunit I [Clostridia bacterium]